MLIPSNSIIIVTLIGNNNNIVGNNIGSKLLLLLSLLKMLLEKSVSALYRDCLRTISQFYACMRRIIIVIVAIGCNQCIGLQWIDEVVLLSLLTRSRLYRNISIYALNAMLEHWAGDSAKAQLIRQLVRNEFRRHADLKDPEELERVKQK